MTLNLTKHLQLRASLCRSICDTFDHTDELHIVFQLHITDGQNQLSGGFSVIHADPVCVQSVFGYGRLKAVTFTDFLPVSRTCNLQVQTHQTSHLHRRFTFYVHNWWNSHKTSLWICLQCHRLTYTCRWSVPCLPGTPPLYPAWLPPHQPRLKDRKMNKVDVWFLRRWSHSVLNELVIIIFDRSFF